MPLGGTGRNIIKTLYIHPTQPQVHAFCRDPKNLKGGNTFHSIVKGNARDTKDLIRALEVTNVDFAIVSVGNGASTAKRMSPVPPMPVLWAPALKQPRFRNVRVVILPSPRCRRLRDKARFFGIGKFIETQWPEKIP